MVAQNIAFGLIAAMATFGAIRVVTTKNIVHAALWLVLVLAAVGASFLLVGGELALATPTRLDHRPHHFPPPFLGSLRTFASDPAS